MLLGAVTVLAGASDFSGLLGVEDGVALAVVSVLEGGGGFLGDGL